MDEVITTRERTPVDVRRPGYRAGGDGAFDGADIWRERTRVVLTPVAAPSVLGLFGFAGATLIVASNLAGWYGNTASGLFLFPFAAMVGGLAQFVAGVWAYRARDAVATAMHGIWGSFWLAYGLLNLLFATHTLTNPGPHFPELGFWFIALGAITASGAIAALAESVSVFAVLGTLAAGCGFAAAGYYGGTTHWLHIAGWLFVFSAGFAWYTATAMMLESTYKRVVLPLGKYRGPTNRPGSVVSDPIGYAPGMPGVRVGQ